MSLLAIGNDASLTGAPLLLLSYLTTACSNHSFDHVRILLGSGGPLTEKYKEIADTFVPAQGNQTGFLHRATRKLAKSLGRRNWEQDQLRSWIKQEQGPDIIYANTVASIPHLSRLLPLLDAAPKLIIHVHELDWLLQKYEAEHNIGVTLRCATKIIAPCDAVAQSLNSLMGVPMNVIQIIPEWICREIHVQRYDKMRAQMRHQLGLKETDTLCIGVGKMQWRKGSDLLPLIASRCLASDSNIHFAWIGSSSANELMQLKLDAKKVGVEWNIHLIPEQDDPYPYYSAADLYMLLSREDPYPVAMLEAGLFQLPVICFEQSGGATEYISNGSGISVPFLDIEGFAAAIQRISRSPKRIKEMGRIARAAVLERHNAIACEKLITKTLCSAIQ